MKARNQQFEFKVENDQSDHVARLAKLLPWSLILLQISLPDIGLDGAHMKKIVLKDLSDEELRKMLPQLNIEDDKKLLRNLTLIDITGRAVDDKQMMYAFSLGYHENSSDMAFLIDFCIEKGLSLN